MHLSWCGGVGLEETQKEWRTWWPANAKDVRIYSPDDCPDRSTLPRIWLAARASQCSLGVFADDIDKLSA